MERNSRVFDKAVVLLVELVWQIKDEMVVERGKTLWKWKSKRDTVVHVVGGSVVDQGRPSVRPFFVN
jgi:hypothetical protein